MYQYLSIALAIALLNYNQPSLRFIQLKEWVELGWKSVNITFLKVPFTDFWSQIEVIKVKWDC